MSNALQISDRDNELLRSADEYLRKHKILELFEVRSYKERIRVDLGLDNHYML